MKPIDAWNSDEVELDMKHRELIDEHDAKVNTKTAKVKENDQVVIPKKKTKFEKGYTMTWSDKPLTITKVLTTTTCDLYVK